MVTIPECVLWHMGKTLHGLAEEFDLTVVGEDVSRYADQFPHVSWIDIDIPRKTSPLRDLKALIQLYWVCLRVRPHIVHSIMPKAGLLAAIAAWLARVPIRVHTFTGQVWATKSGLPRRLYKLLDRLVVLLNTACLTDSPSQSRYLQREGIGSTGQPLPVLGHGSLIGVDLERFDRERIQRHASVNRELLGLTENDLVISYIARKSRDKGAIDMLRGFALAREAAPHMRLLYIGPDESNGELDELRVSQPNLFVSVIERGSVTNHEEYLLLSDVLCMPSYREGFGSIVIDAAALGVPCIGSRIVGLTDSVVDGVTGLLHEAGSVMELSSLLLRIDEDRSLLERLGFAACERARTDFSSEIMTRHLIEFYLSAAKAIQ